MWEAYQTMQMMHAFYMRRIPAAILLLDLHLVRSQARPYRLLSWDSCRMIWCRQ